MVLTRSKINARRGKARIALRTSEDQLVERFNILVRTEAQRLIFAKFFFFPSLSEPCVSSVFKQRVKQIFILWADVYSTQTTRRLLSTSQKLESTTGKAASVCVRLQFSRRLNSANLSRSKSFFSLFPGHS